MIMNWNIINLIVKQQACRLLPPRTAIHSLACRETGAFISVWGDVRDLRAERERTFVAKKAEGARPSFFRSLRDATDLFCPFTYRFSALCSSL